MLVACLGILTREFFVFSISCLSRTLIHFVGLLITALYCHVFEEIFSERVMFASVRFDSVILTSVMFMVVWFVPVILTSVMFISVRFVSVMLNSVMFSERAVCPS